MMEIQFIENKNKRTKPSKTPAFGSVYTNYMFEMTYTSDKGWHDATIKPFEDFTMSPAALCLHYGQTIFEGLKGYRFNNKNVLFRPDANYTRMNASASRMRMPQIDVDFAIEATKQLVQAEENEWFYDEPGSCLYIRPFMFATEPSLNVKEGEAYKFMIIMSPMVSYFSASNINLVTETNHMRVPANGTGEVKNGGNYGGAFSATKNAIDKGYSQVLWLDPTEQKYVEEAGMMNVFFIKDNKLITPATNGSILKGITRDSVITLAKEFDMEVEECSISIDDLIKWHKEGKVTEAFASGTAASIQALDSITHNDYEMKFDYTKNKKYQEIFDYLDNLRNGSVEDKYNFVMAF